MANFYSQNGEDFLLNEIFKDKNEGFFVEIGCIDGRRFSNTLTFEERGWKGICVEAHAGYIELLKRNRPKSIVCHCAAAETDDEESTFYANSRGSLSTLDRSQEDKFKKEFGEFFTGFEEQKVRKRRLDCVFEECGVERIDLMSLDIEGYELEALKGMSFKKFRPTVLVIESESAEHKKSMDAILIPAGYHEIARLHNNLLYSTDKSDALKIGNRVFKGVKLIHTQHPLDKGGDKTISVDIDTSVSTGKNAVLSAVRGLLGCIRK